MIYLMHNDNKVMEMDTLNILNEDLVPDNKWIAMENKIRKTDDPELAGLSYNPLRESVNDFIESQYKLVEDEDVVQDYVHTIFAWETLGILAETEVKNKQNNYWFCGVSENAIPIRK